MGIARSLVVRHSSLDPSYIPVRLRRETLRLGNCLCTFCGKKEKHDVCYDIPKCQGGKTELSNLLVCCEGCRREKDSKTGREYRELLKWRGISKNVHSETTRKPQKIEIHFLDGEILNAETKTLPGRETEGLIIIPKGDGKLVWVNLRGVKKIIFRSADLEKSLIS